jgi:signal transduction histidine kinase
MRDEESRLLENRLLLTNSLFIWIIAIFAVTFILSLYMLWEHYGGLTRELAKRELAERNAQNLSAQLLSAQDQERRKIARDLHDGLGQTLVAGKMIADTIVNRPPERQNWFPRRAPCPICFIRRWSTSSDSLPRRGLTWRVSRAERE